MRTRAGLVNELCFAAEGMAGTAGAASLRRLSRLAAAAPSGRLFGAIATLTDLSAKATQTLERSHAAIEDANEDATALTLASALTQLDDLLKAATPTTSAEPAPDYLRKQR